MYVSSNPDSGILAAICDCFVVSCDESSYIGRPIANSAPYAAELAQEWLIGHRSGEIFRDRARMRVRRGFREGVHERLNDVSYQRKSNPHLSETSESVGGCSLRVVAGVPSTKKVYHYPDQPRPLKNSVN